MDRDGFLLRRLDHMQRVTALLGQKNEPTASPAITCETSRMREPVERTIRSPKRHRRGIADLLHRRPAGRQAETALRMRQPLLRLTHDDARQLACGKRLLEFVGVRAPHNGGDPGGVVRRAQQADQILRDGAATGIAQQIDDAPVGGFKEVLRVQLPT